jgi:hypothetical protein
LEQRPNGTPAGCSLVDWFPDELGDIDHQIRSRLLGVGWPADLPDAHAHHVIQSAVAFVIAEVENRPHDLSTTRRIRAPVAMPFEHDCGTVFCLDDGSEIWSKGTRRALSSGKVGTTEPSSDLPDAMAFGQIEMLLPATLELDFPAGGVRETDPVERFEFHGRVQRSPDQDDGKDP